MAESVRAAAIHELKAHPEPFRAVWFGQKRAEIRSTADRAFAADDVLTLREWVPERQEYTGYSLSVRVTHVQPGGTFGLPADLAVLSIRVVEHIYPSGQVIRGKSRYRLAREMAGLSMSEAARRLKDSVEWLGRVEMEVAHPSEFGPRDLDLMVNLYQVRRAWLLGEVPEVLSLEECRRRGVGLQVTDEELENSTDWLSLRRVLAAAQGS